MHVRRVLLLLAMLLLVFVDRAEAYLDPGTGSMVFQVLAGIVLAAMFSIRRVLTWAREKITFARRETPDDEPR